MASNSPTVHARFDQTTHTISYVVADPATKEAVIIDSVLDYEPYGATISHTNADALLDIVHAHGYQVRYILETHAHADHLSAAQYLRQQLGAPIAIGEHIHEVQETFLKAFHTPQDSQTVLQAFDHAWHDGDTFQIGDISARVIATPGHTPADVTYLIGDAAFVGDTLFMPDYGTARCDFPGGNATTLYQSIQKLYTLPDETRMFLCHDYLPPSRTTFQWETTIGEQKRNNIHVNLKSSEQSFVEMRVQRDATLGMPQLIIPSIQVNIRAGELPTPEENGISYLRIPVNGAFSKSSET